VVDSETDPPPTGITINNSRSRILGGRTADAASTEAKLISVIITDALGATRAIQRVTLIIDSQQPRITPKKNGSELPNGNGFTNFDLVEGDGVSIEATNDGATVQYRVSASGGAGGGIATIAGVGPDSSGNLEIEGIEQDSNGQLRVNVENGVSYTESGIVVSYGSIDGTEILIGAPTSETRSMSPADYDYSIGTSSTWQLWVSPTPTDGTFTIDVRKRAFGNTLPDTGDSICASALPSLSGNSTDFTASGSTSTWTDAPIARGDMVSVAPTVNTAGVTWFALFIPARRQF
jgi:hypothetical protein